MVTKHISKNNVVDSTVMWSDEEIPVFNEIHIGINRVLQLIISIERTDTDNPQYNCCTFAKLSADETLRLARRLKVPTLKLPSYISCHIDAWDDIEKPSLSNTRECFKEITERLLDEGCHFQIKRISGANDYICY
ncbi:MAG: hypothetical protein K2J63_00850 [Muribaculaceae bacterium]|nr:hypothetical protein [Muribaculaceae bacterium]